MKDAVELKFSKEAVEAVLCDHFRTVLPKLMDYARWNVSAEGVTGDVTLTATTAGQAVEGDGFVQYAGRTELGLEPGAA